MSSVDLASKVPAFSTAEWISQGRTYPADNSPFPELVAFHAAALAIPHHARDFLPTPSLSIKQFLSLKLPITAATLVHRSAKQCFGCELPTEDVSCLRTRRIPSKDFVNNANKAFGQALLDGAQSFADPHYKGSPLPLWVVTFWIEMHKVLNARSVWEKTDHWLKAKRDGTARDVVIDQCYAHLDSLGWNAKAAVPGGVETTLEFADLLSDRMIHRTTMDIMVRDIADRVLQDKARSEEFEIVGLGFMYDIEKAKSADDYARKSPPYLYRLEEKLKSSRKKLLFPVHLPKDLHYDGFTIDYYAKEISYGEQ
jgi:hypothetical protein